MRPISTTTQSSIPALILIVSSLHPLVAVASLPAFSPRAAVVEADAPAGTTILRVGTGGGCTHSTIQAAINAASPAETAEIRVNQGTYTEALSIANKAVSIWGGYSNCSAELPSGTSTLLAPPGNRPLTVSASAGDHNSRMLNFNVSGASLSNVDAGGGAWITASGTAFVRFNFHNTFIEANSAGAGGGVAVQTLSGTATVLATFQNNSLINNNEAFADGGGIWCGGPGSNNVFVMGSTGVQGNTAGLPGGSSGRGGGVFLDRCQLSMQSTHNPDFPPTEVRQNQSRGAGGGIYARNSSDVFLFSFSSQFGETRSTMPVRIHNNSATGPAGDLGAGQGGGIWLDASGLNARGAWIDSNVATGNGGGIHAGAASLIDINRQIEARGTGPAPCHTALECSRIVGNRAGDTGGALFLRDSGTVAEIEQSVIRANAAQAGTGASLFAQTGTNLSVTSSLIYGVNSTSGPPNYVFWVGNSATLNLFWSTVTDNAPGTAVFRFGGTNSLLRLRGSIIHEPGRTMGVVSGSDTPTVDSDCMVWHANTLMNPPYNFTGGSDFHLVANPAFANPANGDFALTADSAAVDFCDASVPPGTAPERDLLLRPRGLAAKPVALHGPFDLGALEFVPDQIFRDRFQ